MSIIILMKPQRLRQIVRTPTVGSLGTRKIMICCMDVFCTHTSTLKFAQVLRGLMKLQVANVDN